MQVSLEEIPRERLFLNSKNVKNGLAFLRRSVMPEYLERTNSEGWEDSEPIHVRIEICCDLVAYSIRSETINST